MGKKKKEATKTEKPVVDTEEQAPTEEDPLPETVPEPEAAPVPESEPEPATESKEVLAKGNEWYDDGGNDGLKQRPIGGALE